MPFVVQPSRNRMLDAAWKGLRAGDAPAKRETARPDPKKALQAAEKKAASKAPAKKVARKKGGKP